MGNACAAEHADAASVQGRPWRERPAPLGASETRPSLQNSVIFMAEKISSKKSVPQKSWEGLKDTRVLLLI